MKKLQHHLKSIQEITNMCLAAQVARQRLGLKPSKKIGQDIYALKKRAEEIKEDISRAKRKALARKKAKAPLSYKPFTYLNTLHD